MIKMPDEKSDWIKLGDLAQRKQPGTLPEAVHNDRTDWVKGTKPVDFIPETEKPDTSWNIARGLKSGLLTTAATLPALQSMAFQAGGLKTAAEESAKTAQVFSKETEKYQPDTSFKELVKDPSWHGLLDYGLYTLGSLLPSAMFGLGGGAIGEKAATKLISRKTLENLAKKNLAKGLTKEAAVEAAVNTIAKRGAAAGIIGSTAALEGTGMYLTDYEKHGRDARVLPHVLGGLAAGAVELGLGGVELGLVKKMFGRTAAKVAAKNPEIGKSLLHKAAGIVKESAGEAAEELTQEEIAILNEMYVAKPGEKTVTPLSKEGLWRAAEASAAGFIGGVPLSTLSAAIPTKEQETEQETDNLINRQRAEDDLRTKITKSAVDEYVNEASAGVKFRPAPRPSTAEEAARVFERELPPDVRSAREAAETFIKEGTAIERAAKERQRIIDKTYLPAEEEADRRKLAEAQRRKAIKEHKEIYEVPEKGLEFPVIEEEKKEEPETVKNEIAGIEKQIKERTERLAAETKGRKRSELARELSILHKNLADKMASLAEIKRGSREAPEKGVKFASSFKEIEIPPELPDLEGTNKQKNWAYDIRSEYVTRMNELTDRMMKTFLGRTVGVSPLKPQLGVSPLKPQFNYDKFKQIAEEKAKNTDASWWIDNRDKLKIKDLIKEAEIPSRISDKLQKAKEDIEFAEIAEGSPKQIKWAEKIRSDAVDNILGTSKEKTEEEADALDIENFEYDSFIEFLKTKVFNNTSAKWWINNRSSLNIYDLLDDMEDEYKKWVDENKTKTKTEEKPKVEPEPKIKTEPEPEPEPEIEDSTVSVEMPAKEAETLTLKEQKKYLLAEIEKAKEQASDEKPEPIPLKLQKAIKKSGRTDKKNTAIDAIDKIYERNKARFGTITIEVPGDGDFTIINTKQSLDEFKKKAKKFPETEEMPETLVKELPKLKPSEKRVSGEGISYYNPFRVRKRTLKALPVDAQKNKWDKKNRLYYSSGLIIKLDKAPNVKISDKESVIPVENLEENAPNPASIKGEASIQLEIPVADVVSADEKTHIYISAEYADIMLTRYPDAKIFIGDINEPVVFKVDDKFAGAIMPMAIYSQPVLDELLEGYERLKKSEAVPKERKESEKESKKESEKSAVPEVKPNIDIHSLPIEDITVNLEAIREKTGEKIIIKDTAANAFKDIEDRIEKYLQVLECL